MEIETAATAFKELGHPTRLKIFRYLVKAGESGAPVGDLQRELDVPGSTLSHHISALVSAGLISQKRDGRVLNCVAQYDALQEIIGFLMDECCTGQNYQTAPQGAKEALI